MHCNFHFVMCCCQRNFARNSKFVCSSIWAFTAYMIRHIAVLCLPPIHTRYTNMCDIHYIHTIYRVNELWLVRYPTFLYEYIYAHEHTNFILFVQKSTHTAEIVWEFSLSFANIHSFFLFFTCFLSLIYRAKHAVALPSKAEEDERRKNYVSFFSFCVCIVGLSLFLGGNFSCIFAPINKLITSK